MLTTKLHLPPAHPNLVVRPRLLDRLDEGLRLGRRLTLVSAPAGFGKTTLISAWLSCYAGRGMAADEPAAARGPMASVKPQPTGVAWVSLDEGDNDVVRFFTYVVAALQGVEERIGLTIEELLEAPQPPPAELVIGSLINDIASLPPEGPGLVLVLDDYHFIHELVIHEAIAFLLERQPPQMHLVIATRQDPPLPLSRLRVRQQVTEIREQDLSFSAEEASSFLNQSLGLSLAAPEIAALTERTEGWVAGLQLAGLSIRGRDADEVVRFIARFSGRHHFVLDYLTDEVLRRQPEAVRRFLLQTSILERMCGSLCDAILDEDVDAGAGPDGSTSLVAERPSSSQELLEELERANLFLISLDEERRWYRYHRLFSDLLRALLQETEPERVPQLHRRAAAWFEENGYASEAVDHAMATEDYDLAADLVDRVARKATTWKRIDAATFLDWWQALPGDVVSDRPQLQLYASRAFYATGQWQATERILRDLDRWLEDHPGDADAEGLWELMLADRASYASVRGDERHALEYARQTLARIPQENAIGRMRAMAVLGLASFRAGDVSEAGRAFSQIITFARSAGMPYAAALIACNLVDVHILEGRLRQALQTCQLAIELSSVDGANTSAAGFVGLVLGRILYEQNELQAAERQVLEGLEVLSQRRIPASFGIGHASLAQIRQARGDSAGAQAAIQRAVQLAQGSNIPRILMQASAYQARIWLAQGALGRAKLWAREYRQVRATEYLREFEDLTLARVLLASDRPEAALALLDRLLPPAEAAGRMGRVIEIQSLRALALQMTGEVGEALTALGPALAMAEPEGYVRLFVDEGQPMGALLRRASARGIATGYVQKLLAVFWEETRDQGRRNGDKASIVPSEPFPASPLVEDLTGREIEVLGLLAEGLTNAEIGQRLFISLPTVKSHTRNIYGKLGVHNRRQAVIQAKALGILPAL